MPQDHTCGAVHLRVAAVDHLRPSGNGAPTPVPWAPRAATLPDIVHVAVSRSRENEDCRARLGEVPVHRLNAWLNAAISE